MRRKKRRYPVSWNEASDIADRIVYLKERLDLNWLDIDSIHCMRSNNSSARAYARIWGLSKVWQLALDKSPAYVIEVLSERFDDLPQHKKDEVLLHEIAHIPKNFSGSLLPHVRRRGKRNFHDRVEQLVRNLRKSI